MLSSEDCDLILQEYSKVNPCFSYKTIGKYSISNPEKCFGKQVVIDIDNVAMRFFVKIEPNDKDAKLLEYFYGEKCLRFFGFNKSFLVIPATLNDKFVDDLTVRHIEIILEEAARLHSLQTDELASQFLVPAKFLIERDYEDLLSYLPLNTKQEEYFLNEFKDLQKNQFNLKKLWCCNILRGNDFVFTYENGAPVSGFFVNFENARYAPIANDIVSIILLLKDESTRYFNKLVKHYCDMFEKYDSIDDNFKSETEKSTKKFLKAFKIKEILNKMIIEFDDSNNLEMHLDDKRKITETIQTKYQSELYELNDLITYTLVTKEDVYEVINEVLGGTNYVLQEYILVPLEEKAGYYGDHFILKVTISVNNLIETHRLFVKSLPQAEAQQKFAIETGATYKEFAMFEKIIPALKENNVNIIGESVAKCFLTRLNDVAIYEDLGCKNYRTLKPRESMQLPFVKLVVNSLAKMHAAGFILEEIKSKQNGYNYSLLDQYRNEFKESLFSESKCSIDLVKAGAKGLSTQINIFKDELDDVDIEKFRQTCLDFCRDLFDVVKPSKTYRNTICHSDLWTNNILFKFDKDDKPLDCKFVDFQMYRYRPPSHDLLGYIYFCTDRKFREKHLHEVVKIYFEDLSNALEAYGYNINNILTYEEFLASCNEVLPYCLVVTCLQFHCVMFTPEQMEVFFSREGCNHKFFYEDRSDLIKEACETDPVYKSILRGAILDVKDWFKCKKFMVCE